MGLKERINQANINLRAQSDENLSNVGGINFAELFARKNPSSGKNIRNFFYKAKQEECESSIQNKEVQQRGERELVAFFDYADSTQDKIGTVTEFGEEVKVCYTNFGPIIKVKELDSSGDLKKITYKGFIKVKDQDNIEQYVFSGITKGFEEEHETFEGLTVNNGQFKEVKEEYPLENIDELDKFGEGFVAFDNLEKTFNQALKQIKGNTQFENLSQNVVEDIAQN